jgi:hypothetical protein
MGVPRDRIFHLISTLITDSENINTDYKIEKPISAEHPKFVFNHIMWNELKINQKANVNLYLKLFKYSIILVKL